MRLSLTDLQTEIAVTAADFLRDRLPISKLRQLARDGGPAIDELSWGSCAQMGWLAVAMPEALGGLGLGLPELAALFREFGRNLTPGPFRSTILAARLASEAGEATLAVALASGKRRCGLRCGNFAVDVRPGDLILSLDGSGGALHEVISADDVPGVDPGTRLSRVVEGAEVANLADPLLLAWARVIIAAELLGIIEAVRDMSAAYSLMRVQFGRPIGSFQAVKHRCADMAVAGYSVQAQTFMAAYYVNGRHQDAAFHAASALVLAIGGASTSTADNIQNHGGIGMTAEHDAHLFVKRALLLEHLLGTRRDLLSAVLKPERHRLR